MRHPLSYRYCPVSAHVSQAELSGPVDFRHVFLDMGNVTVQPSPWTRAGRTCPPAMGMSFAAGTTDGERSIPV